LETFSDCVGEVVHVFIAGGFLTTVGQKTSMSWYVVWPYRTAPVVEHVGVVIM
jgi:hypothetical protein